MLIRRRISTPREDPTLHLLHDLLQARTVDARLRPVVLRSLKQQRRTVLAPYPLRTWFDRALTIGERLLGLAVLLFFCWWLVDGYGRDWWHARNAPPMPQRPAYRLIGATPADGMPTLLRPAVDLGASLPVVDERWTRPRVLPDYMVPARMYVPPLEPAPPPSPTPEAAPPRDLRPLRVSAPTVGLDSDVVEVFVQDGAWQVADYAVGYHHGTGLAGQSNMVLAGHKGLRGGVFRHLEQLKPGDPLVVDAAGEHWEYRVRSTSRVWPDQVDVMFPTEHAQLTLLTCTNWDTQRFVVVADFVGATPMAAGGN